MIDEASDAGPTIATFGAGSRSKDRMPKFLRAPKSKPIKVSNEDLGEHVPENLTYWKQDGTIDLKKYGGSSEAEASKITTTRHKSSTGKIDRHRRFACIVYAVTDDTEESLGPAIRSIRGQENARRAKFDKDQKNSSDKKRIRSLEYLWLPRLETEGISDSGLEDEPAENDHGDGQLEHDGAEDDGEGAAHD